MRWRWPPESSDGEALRERRRQSDLSEQRADAVEQLGPPREALDAQGLSDLVADAHPRVQRGLRILEDDLELAAPAPKLRSAQRQPVLAGEVDAARVGLQEPGDDPAGRRLSAPRLPHQTERLAGGDAKADAPEGGEVPVSLLEALGGEQRGVHDVSCRKHRANPVGVA